MKFTVKEIEIAIDAFLKELREFKERESVFNAARGRLVVLKPGEEHFNPINGVRKRLIRKRPHIN